MVARGRPARPSDDYDALATQWFIVSDLGLTAFSGNDGIHVFVHSLATTEPKGAVEVRLMSRSNEVLATKRTERRRPRAVRGRVWRAARARWRRPCWSRATPRATTPSSISRRRPSISATAASPAAPVPAGLDAFVYTERGVYRSGETVHVTALLRDAQGVAALDVPLTLVVERPDGVEYRRTVVPDQGVGGRALGVPMVSSAPTGTWRVRAFTDPKRPPVGETTFMVEDYVPDRLEFELASHGQGRLARRSPAEITRRRPLSLRRAGRQARARRRGDRSRRPRSGRALPAISSA